MIISSMLIFNGCTKKEELLPRENNLNTTSLDNSGEMQLKNGKYGNSSILLHYDMMGKEHNKILKRLPVHPAWPDFTSISLETVVFDLVGISRQDYPEIIPYNFGSEPYDDAIVIIGSFVKDGTINGNMASDLMDIINIVKNHDNYLENINSYIGLISNLLKNKEQEILNNITYTEDEKYSLLLTSSVARHSLTFWLTEGLKDHWLDFKQIDPAIQDELNNKPNIQKSFLYDHFNLIGGWALVDCMEAMYTFEVCDNHPNNYPHGTCVDLALGFGGLASAEYR